MAFFHSLPVPEFREWIFFIPFPFPNFGNGFFSFPSRSRILGMDFFIPFPFPNFGNGFFPFPSRSRIWGIGFFNSLPVPESSKVIPAHPCWVKGTSSFPDIFYPTFFLLQLNPTYMKRILYNKMCIIIYFLPISSHKMCEASAEHILWHWNR